ncbi:MAG: GNAT family N-acetyltransferase [Flavobacteriaceae bacterium]|nr:GNAT family N-acetyltransferase [Flavobacteriaceae bacterium]|tara:strand:+ start:598 stop:1209 length:612 start_codon:yes stop_codon:yes gene_type:complete
MNIIRAKAKHITYAKIISECIDDSAKSRGTGIARRTPEYIHTKMSNGNAIIALDNDKFAGFCYIEVWGHGKYVAHSGLIVAPKYRGQGLAKKIKKEVFELSLMKYPTAKVFGITTGMAVMKINYQLGYKPVHFSELTDDPEFWKGCKTCKNYDILTRTERKMCLCTGMLYDPDEKIKPKKIDNKVFKRLKKIKETLLFKNKKS